MFFSLSVLVVTVIFFGALELSAFLKKDIVYAIFILIAISLFTILRVKAIGRKWNYAPIVGLLAFSSMSLLYLINFNPEKQIFIVIASALYYLGMIGILRLRDYDRDETARGLLSAVSLATLFFFYSSLYGFYLNFAVPLWALMLLFLLATYAISYYYFCLFVFEKKIVRIISLVLGLAIAEIGWIINFWPFGYLTTGVIMLMIFFVFWDLAQSYFLKNLSMKRVFANLFIVLLLCFMVLATSRWLPTS